MSDNEIEKYIEFRKLNNERAENGIKLYKNEEICKVGIDLANGKDFTVDCLIRHKWPEEKPERDGTYLVLMSSSPDSYYVINYLLGEWRKWVFSGLMGGWMSVYNVTHWWGLPEVVV